MFGLFRKRKIENQLKWSFAIQKLLMFGLYKYESLREGPSSSSQKRRLIAVTINSIFATKMDYNAIAQEGIDKEDIDSYAMRILSSDKDLERVIVRNLHAILTLSLALNKKSEAIVDLQSRLENNLAPYRCKYPELFSDVDDQEYKSLLINFAETYYPDMKSKIDSLLWPT